MGGGEGVAVGVGAVTVIFGEDVDFFLSWKFGEDIDRYLSWREVLRGRVDERVSAMEGKYGWQGGSTTVVGRRGI